jgi:hypothetical protein
MVKRSLALLLVAALVAGASATSTGILYWCAMEEMGSNIPAATSGDIRGSPRSIWGTYSGGRLNTACHDLTQNTNAQFTFSNGTVLPNACASGTCSGFSPYDIAPTGCLVSPSVPAPQPACLTTCVCLPPLRDPTQRTHCACPQ